MARRFGLRERSPDPALSNLLALGGWVEDDLIAAIALSGMTGPRIRETFPAGHTDVRVIPCLSGLDLKADMADIFAASAALGRLQEEADFEAFMSLVEPGAVVVDVGANFGLYAAHAALYAGPSGRVFAFEPAPETFDLLQSNLTDDAEAAQSLAVRAAVGAADGKAQFRLAADSAFSGLRDTGRSKTVGHVEVEVLALDSFEPLAGCAADLIKIDTEGGEPGVFAGAHGLLARSPDVIVMFEFSHKNLDDAAREALIAELDRLGAEGLALYSRRRDSQGLAALEPGALQGARSENLYLVRPGTPALARLEAAMRRPALEASPDQAAAIEILRQHGHHLKTHQDLCHRIIELARATLGPDVEPHAMQAVESLAAGLREAKSSDPAAQFAALQARHEALQAAHLAVVRRLEATAESRERHRTLAEKLNDEVQTLRGQRQRLSERLTAVRSRPRRASEGETA